jgi:hypothetical protein
VRRVLFACLLVLVSVVLMGMFFSNSPMVQASPSTDHLSLRWIDARDVLTGSNLSTTEGQQATIQRLDSIIVLLNHQIQDWHGQYGHYGH